MTDEAGYDPDHPDRQHEQPPGMPAPLGVMTSGQDDTAPAEDTADPGELPAQIPDPPDAPEEDDGG